MHPLAGGEHCCFQAGGESLTEDQKTQDRSNRNTGKLASASVLRGRFLTHTVGDLLRSYGLPIQLTQAETSRQKTLGHAEIGRASARNDPAYLFQVLLVPLQPSLCLRQRWRTGRGWQNIVAPQEPKEVAQPLCSFWSSA